MTRNTTFVTPEEKAQREARAKADQHRQLLDDNPKLYIDRHTIRGHAFESHVANSHRSLLNNVLSGRKLGDTVFNNEETQTYCMQEILYAKMGDIQNWVKKAKNGDKNLYAIDFVDIDTGEPVYIGDGFVSDAQSKTCTCQGTAQVNYIQSNTAGIVIKKNPDAPDGWEITTAFPMSHPSADRTTEETSIIKPNKSFKNLLHQTITYQNASPAKKLYLDIKCADNLTDPEHIVAYSPQQDCVTIRQVNSGNQPSIKVKSDMSLALSSCRRPDINLNTPDKLQIAKRSVSDLLQHTQELVAENTETKSKNARPRAPTAPNFRDVSDLRIATTDTPTQPNLSY